MSDRPNPTNPNLALAQAKAHLEELKSDGTVSAQGWIIDESRLESELVLIVTIPARTKSGDLHPDGRYYLELSFRYYPVWPPVVKFINPATRQYSPQFDQSWIPQIASKPPGVNVQFHPAYDASGQLVCHSLSFDYYIRGGHNPRPEERWVEGRHTFGSTLLLHDQLLREPYYGGRRS